MLGRIWVNRSGSQHCRFLIHCDEHDQNNVVFFICRDTLTSPYNVEQKERLSLLFWEMTYMVEIMVTMNKKYLLRIYIIHQYMKTYAKFLCPRFVGYCIPVTHKVRIVIRTGRMETRSF